MATLHPTWTWEIKSGSTLVCEVDCKLEVEASHEGGSFEYEVVGILLEDGTSLPDWMIDAGLDAAIEDVANPLSRISSTLDDLASEHFAEGEE